MSNYLGRLLTIFFSWLQNNDSLQNCAKKKKQLTTWIYCYCHFRSRKTPKMFALHNHGEWQTSFTCCNFAFFFSGCFPHTVCMGPESVSPSSGFTRTWQAWRDTGPKSKDTLLKYYPGKSERQSYVWYLSKSLKLSGMKFTYLKVIFFWRKWT